MEYTSNPPKFGGYRLAVYQWEHEEAFPEFRKVKFEKERAMFYIKKLARHFKTSCPTLSEVRKRNGGHYQPSMFYPRIALPKNPSLGLICHEYAHHLDHVRNPNAKQWHGKSFRCELKKVYTFAKRYLPKEKLPTPVESNLQAV